MKQFSRMLVVGLFLIWTSIDRAYAVESDLDIFSDIAMPDYFGSWVVSANHGLLHELGYVAVPLPVKPATIPLKGNAPRANKPALKPTPESAYENLFIRFGNQFNVPVSTLKKIAYCESHYNPAANSKNQTYGGMYQFSASTWESTRKAMGMDSDPVLRYDAEQSILTAAFKIAAGGIGAWPTCGSR
jgi:hypothetical protein